MPEHLAKAFLGTVILVAFWIENNINSNHFVQIEYFLAEKRVIYLSVIQSQDISHMKYNWYPETL